MIDFTDIAVFIGMLLLRVGVPAMIVLGVGYFLKRLDRRWEAEARAYQAKVAAQQPAEQPTVQPEAPAPSRRPGKQPVTPQPLPFIPALLDSPACRPRASIAGMRRVAAIARRRSARRRPTRTSHAGRRGSMPRAMCPKSALPAISSSAIHRCSTP
jgi:hypothetical protein